MVEVTAGAAEATGPRNLGGQEERDQGVARRRGRLPHFFMQFRGRPGPWEQAGGEALALRGQGSFSCQFQSDAAQAFGEELGLAAQPDAEEAFQAQVHAGDDQDALVDTDALA